jgi:hypothetical protein
MRDVLIATPNAKRVACSRPRHQQALFGPFRFSNLCPSHGPRCLCSSDLTTAVPGKQVLVVGNADSVYVLPVRLLRLVHEWEHRSCTPLSTGATFPHTPPYESITW